MHIVTKQLQGWVVCAGRILFISLVLLCTLPHDALYSYTLTCTDCITELSALWLLLGLSSANGKGWEESKVRVFIPQPPSMQIAWATPLHPKSQPLSVT